MTKLKCPVFFFYFILVFWRITAADEDAYSHNEKIRNKVLKNYDKNALPQRDKNDTTSVYVQMAPRSFYLDDKEQILTLNAWVPMRWQDKRLAWDYKDFGGVNRVHFSDDELWKPDFTLYNNARISELDHYGNVHFIVDADGSVLWVPPASMMTPCPMDLKYWPFDEHTCDIIMGSWTTHGWQVNLELWRNHTEMARWALLEHSSGWKLLTATQLRMVTKYQGVSEPYIAILYQLTLKRNSPTFASVVVVPAIAIPLLLLVQFILPVDHSKRLSIAFVSSILTLLELLFLKMSLPKLGTSVPLIVSYYAQCFIMVVITVILSAILSRLAHPTNPLLDFPPPELVKRFLTGPLAVILCLREHASKVGLSGKLSEEGEVLDGGKTANYSHEWLLVAKVIDRIAFIVFICAFVLSLIIYVSQVK